MSWHKTVMKEMDDAWETFVAQLEKALNELEADIKDTKAVGDKCTGEWCTATEHVLDELHNAIFSIHEPRFTDDTDKSSKIKELKKRIRDLYAEYKA